MSSGGFEPDVIIHLGFDCNPGANLLAVTKNNSRTKRRSTRRLNGKSTSRGTNVTRSSFVPPRNWLSTHIGGFPQSQRQTLVYTAHSSGTIPFNTFNEIDQFVLNSPYQPCAPIGGGASAVGFAKYMAVYTKCFVMGARFKIYYLAVPNSGTFVPQHAGVTITTNGTAPTAIDSTIASGLVVHDYVYQNPDHLHFSNAIDIGKFLDKPKVLDDPQLFCTATTAPGQIVVAHLWCANFSSALASGFNFTIEIEYDCVFTDPQPFT
jgi:hypothetical protein